MSSGTDNEMLSSSGTDLDSNQLTTMLEEDSDSSEGELGELIEDVPPPESGQLDVPADMTNPTSPGGPEFSTTILQVEQSINVLNDRARHFNGRDVPSSTHLSIIKSALDHFMHQQEYFQKLAQENEQLRNKIHLILNKLSIILKN